MNAGTCNTHTYRKMSLTGCCLGNAPRLVRQTHRVSVLNNNYYRSVKSSYFFGNVLDRQRIKAIGTRAGLYSNEENSKTLSRALPEKSSSSPFIGNDFIEKYDSTIEDILGSQYRMMRSMERDMERAMERAVAAQEGMMTDGQEAASLGKKQWKREWKSQTPTSSSYFSESVTIIQPTAGAAANSRNLFAQGSSAAVGLVALLPLILLSVSWARKTREFMNAYDQTVYKDTRSKWLLVSLWPLLCLVSPKFRKEWDRVMVMKRQGEGIDTAMGNPSSNSIDDDALGSADSLKISEKL